MKFQREQQVFTESRVDGVYPTVNIKAIVRDYNSLKKRYLLDFEKYVGGFAIKYKRDGEDKATKIGFGLWVNENEISKIKYYKEIANGSEDDDIESEE